MVEDQQAVGSLRQRQDSSMSPLSESPVLQSRVSWSHVLIDRSAALNFSSSLLGTPSQASPNTELPPSQTTFLLMDSPVGFHLPSVSDSADETMEEDGSTTELTHLSWSDVPISLVGDISPEGLEFLPSPGPGSPSFPLPGPHTPLPANSSPAGYQSHFEGKTPGISLYYIPELKLISDVRNHPANYQSGIRRSRKVFAIISIFSVV